MKGSILFTKNLELLRKGARRITNQGGQYSGKTVNILGAYATLCAEEDEGVTTVTSMSFPHLKGGALRDFETYVYPSFKSAIKSYHKTDHIFTFKSGPILEFKVFDNEFAARGQKRKRLFVNEANKFDWMTFFQLDSRSEQTVIDYNPTVRFWAHEKVIGQPGNHTLISDHRHNPFLTPQKHAEIEAYTGELFKVYSRGATGNVQGVIFPNWQMIDDVDFPRDQDADWVYSVDFGYTNDPTCIIKQTLIANTLFVKELCYEPGLPPISQNEILLANGYKNYMPLYCDHDPDQIKILRKFGLSAMFARKGQGSVNAGIELLRTFNVKYSSSSQNLHREIPQYVWVTDEKRGKLTNEPIDQHNHAMDAIRYGAYSKYLRSPLTKAA